MEKTAKGIKNETDIAKRVPRCYEEPDPECRFDIACGSLEEFKELSDERRERITCVRVDFVSDIHSGIMELKRFPNLRSIMFFCCYGSDVVGIEAYRGLAEFVNLDTLIFHDSGVIDAETMKEIAALPRLRSLKIENQRITGAAVFSVLKDCEALEYLNLGAVRDEVFAEDLAFVSCLKNLKWLELDMCQHVDVSKLHLPESLEAFTPPNYGYKVAKKIVPAGCIVLKPEVIHPPLRDRFTPETQKRAAAQECKAERKKRREAALGMSHVQNKIETAIKTLKDNLPIAGYDAEELETTFKDIEHFLSERLA